MSLPPAPHGGELAARRARDELGLGETAPVGDLLTLVEDAGVLVLVEKFGADDIAGVLVRHNDGESLVYLNADHYPVRQRFTLAHELGHLQLGHRAGVDWTADLFAGRRGSQQEVEANYFAAELLAPRKGIVAWLERFHPGTIDAETLVRLAVHYGVAQSTMCYRLERSGIVSPHQKKQLLEEAVRPRDFGLQPFSDSLEALWATSGYPRVPRQTVAYAREARSADLIDDVEFTDIVGAHVDVGIDEPWLS